MVEVFDGSWRPEMGSWSLHAADYNGDGAIDLVPGDSKDNLVHLLPGDGVGGFGDPVSFEPMLLGLTEDSFLAGVADLNGDNLTDLVLVDWTYVGQWPEGVRHTYVLLGAGDGNFSMRHILKSPAPFMKCAVYEQEKLTNIPDSFGVK